MLLIGDIAGELGAIEYQPAPTPVDPAPAAQSRPAVILTLHVVGGGGAIEVAVPKAAVGEVIRMLREVSMGVVEVNGTIPKNRG